jgi:hypothetical protein
MNVSGGERSFDAKENKAVSTGPMSKKRFRGLLKRAGLVGEKKSSCVHGRATTAVELEQAYRLVYQVFVDRGFVIPSATGLRMRPYELCPETATFISKSSSSSVVGVMSVLEDSLDLGLASDIAFKAELDEIRE